MQRVHFSIQLTDCPRCGQSVPKVVRQFGVHSVLPQTHILKEDCMACLLSVDDPAATNFLKSQWRLQWQWAGGRVQDMPECLRLPDDPTTEQATRPQPVKVLKPAGKPRPIFPPGQSWKPVTSVIPPPPKTRLPVRVLWVLHNLHTEGSQRAVLNIVRHTRNISHSVHAPEGGPLLDAFALAGCPFVETFQPQDYDLVVLNTVATWEFMKLCRRAGVHPVWYLHEESPDPFLPPDHFREFCTWAKKVVFAAEHQKQKWDSLVSVSSAVIPTVIPPMLRTTSRSAESNRLRKGAKYVVLSFGMDEPRKGQADIKAAIEGLKLKPLLIHGAPNPFDYLSAADVYVVSSRYETFGLSLQEAKAFQLPVIATDIAANRLMIEDGVNGFLYQPGDIEQLRGLIVRLMTDPQLAAEIGRSPIRGPTWPAAITAIERLLLAEAGAAQADADEVTVVYHIAAMGDYWREVVTEQLGQLAAAGLRRAFITHVGKDLAWILAEGHRLGMELVCTFTDERLTHYERPAFELIERLAYVGNKPILYIHSKGVSHPKDDTFWQEWRRLLMDAVVDDWRAHVRSLDEYDAVGVNWWNAEQKWHFSGNMWIAHPRWLRQLPQFGRFYRDRFSCETWIGSVPGCKAKSLLCADARFWQQERTLFWELRKAQQASKPPIHAGNGSLSFAEQPTV